MKYYSDFYKYEYMLIFIQDDDGPVHDDNDDEDDEDDERRRLAVASGGGRYFQVSLAALQETRNRDKERGAETAATKSPALVRSPSSEGSISLSSNSSRSASPVLMIELEPDQGADDDDDVIMCQSVIPPNPWSRRAAARAKPAAAAPRAGISFNSQCS